MSKNLVIVESPSKSKTIEKYLGKDFKVVSSKGHIRDLATSGPLGLGVDIDNDFKPSNYTIVLGIISKYNEARPRIPFFSKVAIRYTVKTLLNLGYRIEIKNIHNLEA